MTSTSSTPTTTTAGVPARAGGAVLASAVRAIAALRPSRKPLHPRGAVVAGVLHRHGGSEPSGVAWLDEPGADQVLVRLSRAVGLPAPLPDIFGLALRIPGEQPSDLLLATTGDGALSRFLLAPRLEGRERVFTSLLPYRSAEGSVLLSARKTSDDAYQLLWARPTGDWVDFARLELTQEPHGDASISFDPVAHPLPGLENHDWVRRLRQPAYRTARRSSGRST